MPDQTIGLPKMLKETGERRVFLPSLLARLHRSKIDIFLEHDYGSEVGLTKSDYLKVAPNVKFADHETVYQQDYVLVLRCPTDDELKMMKPGSCLISMLHYPTRPKRVEFLQSLGIEAISLDSLKDDSGRRLVENLKAVAWNGISTAITALKMIYPQPGFESADREPIRITLLGPGAVGVHVIQAAVNYGNPGYRKELANKGIPGVMVTAVDYDLTKKTTVIKNLLEKTDILVDATQRPNPSEPVIPNSWVNYLPHHAVLLDLSVDPYDCDTINLSVKGIEGIPQGNLDKYIFPPDDPAYSTLPDCVNSTYRRHAVSCYSWPGITPKECMEVYGSQLQPILRVLFDRGGFKNIKNSGRFFERVIHGALLSNWIQTNP